MNHVLFEYEVERLASFFKLTSQRIQMRHPIQGQRFHEKYRVETPYKNGHLDHVFADKTKALAFADESAAEFGMAIMFDHLTNEIMHISYHLGQFGKNAKQFDYTDEIDLKKLKLATKNNLEKEVAK